ncbi:MAG: transglutaminase-like domain-containing protein [Syntrophomonas sp.]|nr:transglutaminase-like domain-containing protein [Syntrophomonas sp.]
MLRINIVTVILIGIFAVPIIFGAYQDFSRERIKFSLWSLLNSLEFLFGLFVAIYLTRRIFFDNDSGVFNQIYNEIPENIRTFLYGQDVMIYIIVVPLILLLVRIILRLFTSLLFNAFGDSLANGLYTLFDSMGSVFKRIIGALSQVPRAVFLVFILGLLLNFYAYYFPSPFLSRSMNQSAAYQILYKNAVCPVLNSNIAKKIPVLVNDSFGKGMERVIPDIGDSGGNSTAEQLVNQLKKSNIRVITYFNGVTLDEAIKSNSQIDETARKIVGNEQNSKKKAYLIYKWLSQNMQYDYDKAAMISKDPSGISSGSIIAFNTRKGICFDYSSLYISMCRAVGVKVRLITGLGYSGVAWGDHAWNQVYCSEEGRWINVDTTFGTNGKYFDKADFNVDHRYAEIQGEW